MHFGLCICELPARSGGAHRCITGRGCAGPGDRWWATSYSWLRDQPSGKLGMSVSCSLVLISFMYGATDPQSQDDVGPRALASLRCHVCGTYRSRSSRLGSPCTPSLYLDVSYFASWHPWTLPLVTGSWVFLQEPPTPQAASVAQEVLAPPLALQGQ